MSKQSDAVKRWRKNTKHKLVQLLGGACQCCGYAACEEAMEFHHIDPAQKELCFGALRASPKSWEFICHEMQKCVLLCCRCHREFHAGHIALPDTYHKLDLDEALKTGYPKTKTHPCAVCGKQTIERNITCSSACAGKRRQKANWSAIDLIEELKTISIVALADRLGVSDMAVRKRLKKLRPVDSNHAICTT